MHHFLFNTTVQTLPGSQYKKGKMILSTPIAFIFTTNRGYKFKFSSGTNNKGVCNMIRTRPSFHSLSFGYLPQPAHMKFIRQVVKAIQRKW